MLGDTVMVIPNVLEDGTTNPQDTVPIPIPSNHLWYPLDLDGVHDPDLPGMSIRGGSILVTQEPQQFVGEKPLTKIIVYVALNEEGKASGELYLDAGDGYDYQSGQYLLTKFSARLIGSQFIMDLVDEGKFARPFSSVEVHVLQQKHTPTVRTFELQNNSVSFTM